MDQFFLSVNEWMTAGSLLAILGSFLLGMISALFSPCHLAAIPLMVCYVAGQEAPAAARPATQYALAFTGGLFLTIATIGVLCSVMGWMLGDVGSYWTIAVGAVLLWVALDMFGARKQALRAEQRMDEMGGGDGHRAPGSLFHGQTVPERLRLPSITGCRAVTDRPGPVLPGRSGGSAPGAIASS
jgi:cytochrome c biogenesis protein CcdA